MRGPKTPNRASPLSVAWAAPPDARVDKGLRAALLRRSRDAPGLAVPVAHPRTRTLRLTSNERLTDVRATRTAEAPGGEWLLHDLDDDGRQVAWAYRPNAVRDVVVRNPWPTLVEPGEPETVLLVVWPDDLDAAGLETPSYDLWLAWDGGSAHGELPVG